jgi:hypothetical protein
MYCDDWDRADASTPSPPALMARSRSAMGAGSGRWCLANPHLSAANPANIRLPASFAGG